MGGWERGRRAVLFVIRVVVMVGMERWVGVCVMRGVGFWVVFMRHYGLVAGQGNKDTVAHDLAITDDEQETL